MITTIQKWGNSQGIRIPKHILDSVNLVGNEQIDLSVEDEKIIIKKIARPQRKNIKELFAGFEEEYTPVEMDWGKPVGKEIW